MSESEYKIFNNNRKCKCIIQKHNDVHFHCNIINQ